MLDKSCFLIFLAYIMVYIFGESVVLKRALGQKSPLGDHMVKFVKKIATDERTIAIAGLIALAVAEALLSKKPADS